MTISEEELKPITEKELKLLKSVVEAKFPAWTANGTVHLSGGLKVKFADILPRLLKEYRGMRVKLKRADDLLQDVHLKKQCSEGTLSMTVARLGGLVEGRPTGRQNLLQRVDELREKESQFSEKERVIEEQSATIQKMKECLLLCEVLTSSWVGAEKTVDCKHTYSKIKDLIRQCLKEEE